MDIAFFQSDLRSRYPVHGAEIVKRSRRPCLVSETFVQGIKKAKRPLVSAAAAKALEKTSRSEGACSLKGFDEVCFEKVAVRDRYQII